MPEEKIAIVTGATRGLGKEIARKLIREDLFVVMGARDPRKGEDTAAGISSRRTNYVVMPLDVTDDMSVRRFVEKVEKEHGLPGILVNNAGIFPEKGGASFLTTSDELWRRTLETNLLGAVRMCRAVVPLMKKAGSGRIVNLSSQMGQFAHMGAGSPAYRASKAALNALTCMLSAELAGTGILVNSMDPGWVHTDMGGPRATRTVEQGADTAVWLSLLPPDGPTGQFFRDRKPVPW